MGSAQNRILTFMGVLDNTGSTGIAAVNEAVAAVSNFSGAAEWVDCLALDLRHYQLNGRSSTDFLNDVPAILLDNADTGAIIGSDAGSGIERTATSIVLEDTNPSYPTDWTSYFEGLTVHWTAPSGTAQECIVYGLNSWWIQQGLRLIAESYGMGFAESGATVRDMTVNFVDWGKNGTLAATTCSMGSNGVTTGLALNINMAYYNDILPTDYNGLSVSSSGSYLDRVIAHELVHAVMAANIPNAGSLPGFLLEGLAELVHGADDGRRSDILALAADETALRNALNLAPIGNVASDGYAAGYLALRYLANRGGSVFASAVSTFRESSVAYYDFDYTTLLVKKGISGEAWLDGSRGVTYLPSVKNIDASASNGTVILAGNEAENLIAAGRGSASLWGGSGAASDTLQGGSGHNDFFYGAGEGNDLIEDYLAGDVIDVYQGMVHSVALEGSNFIMGIDDGSLTVTNCMDRVIDVAVHEANGTAHAYLSTTAGDIDGRSLSGFEVIFGSAAGQSIYAGNGGSSLWGGTGKEGDVLRGGNGADTFIYGPEEGTDYIQNSSSADRVLLYGGASPSSVEVDGTTLTLAFSEGNSLVIQGWSLSGMNTFLDEKGSVSQVVRNEDGTWSFGSSKSPSKK